MANENHGERFVLGLVIVTVIGFVGYLLYETLSIGMLESVLYAMSFIAGVAVLSYVSGWLSYRVLEGVERWGEDR